MATIPLNKLAERLGATLGETARAIKIKIFDGVILDTRVDTGRLRGNWQTTTGTEADGELERIDPSGAQAMADVRGTVKGDAIDFLTNNLPYAEVWEEKDGMIARNVARLGRTIKEVVK